jgi:hypothetical protein
MELINQLVTEGAWNIVGTMNKAMIRAKILGNTWDYSVYNPKKNGEGTFGKS